MDAVTSFVSSLSMPTFCSANDLLNTYVVKVADAIKGIDLQQHADAVAESTASFIAGKLAATTMLGAGAVLVLLPVVFGRKWLGFVITLLSVLFGIVGTSYLIQDQPNSAALFTGAAPRRARQHTRTSRAPRPRRARVCALHACRDAHADDSCASRAAAAESLSLLPPAERDREQGECLCGGWHRRQAVHTAEEQPALLPAARADLRRRPPARAARCASPRPARGHDGCPRRHHDRNESVAAHAGRRRR